MTRRRIYLFLMALLLVALTVLLSAAAIRIWQEGAARKARSPLEAVYTPEGVEAALLRISPLLLAVIGLAAAGRLWGIRGGDCARPRPLPEAERNLLVSRLKEPGEAIRGERNRQRILRWISRAAFAVCMIPVLIYCADRSHFPENDLEAMISSLVLHTAPWTAAGLLLLLIGELLAEKSVRREIDAARARLKAEKGGRPDPAAAGELPPRGTAAIQILLLLAAGGLIVLGVLNGGLNDVLLKAINICTECIGLG